MFSSIPDTVDSNIVIIRNDQTGFYNVTKAAKQFYELNLTTSRKEIKNWLRLEATKTLIEAVEQEYKLQEALFKLNSDTRDEYKGTYVHHALYRAFLMWLDPKYAIKIFAILDNYQHTFEEELKNKNRSLEELNNSIHTKLDALIERYESQSKRNEEHMTILKEHAERTEEQFEIMKDHAEDLKFDLELTRTSLNSKLDTVVGLLEEKSRVSTKNPRNPNMIHHFLVMGHSFMDDSDRIGKRLSFIAGQDTRIKVAKRQKLQDSEHQWNVEIEKHYNANPIDLRNNIADVVNAFINRRIQEINSGSTTPISREDIPITCKKLSATYVDNEYISYEELKDVINSVNLETQRSPYDIGLQ
jgi:hypothetical protein